MRYAREEVSRSAPSPLAQKGRQASPSEVGISAQDLIRSLPVQHDLDSCLLSGPEHAILRVQTRTRRRHVLHVRELFEVGHELRSGWSDLVNLRARSLTHDVHPLLFVQPFILCNVAERVEIDIRLQIAHRHNDR